MLPLGNMKILSWKYMVWFTLLVLNRKVSLCRKTFHLKFLVLLLALGSWETGNAKKCALNSDFLNLWTHVSPWNKVCFPLFSSLKVTLVKLKLGWRYFFSEIGSLSCITILIVWKFQKLPFTIISLFVHTHVFPELQTWIPPTNSQSKLSLLRRKIRLRVCMIGSFSQKLGNWRSRILLPILIQPWNPAIFRPNKRPVLFHHVPKWNSAYL